MFLSKFKSSEAWLQHLKEGLGAATGNVASSNFHPFPYRADA